MKFIRYQTVAINTDRISSLDIYGTSVSIISADTGVNPMTIVTSDTDAALALVKSIARWVAFSDSAFLDLTDYK